MESWRYCQEHKGLQIHAYTIMPNHLHAILSCNEPFYLESVMRDWKAHTARQVLMYLEDSSQPESRREWLLHMFSYFAAG
ncbi:MAG: transposase, partial [Bacteroidetes bacterium]